MGLERTPATCILSSTDDKQNQTKIYVKLFIMSYLLVWEPTKSENGRVDYDIITWQNIWQH